MKKLLALMVAFGMLSAMAAFANTSEETKAEGEQHEATHEAGHAKKGKKAHATTEKHTTTKHEKHEKHEDKAAE